MSDGNSTVTYRNVEGFPGYRVGDDGSVWTSWKRQGNGRGGTTKWILGTEWHRLAPGIGTRGHLSVTLCPGRHQRLVHTLVLEAFVGPRPKGMQARHFPDRNPANNAATNLLWGTPKQNSADRVFHGTDIQGEKHGMAKLTEALVRDIRLRLASGEMQVAIARDVGVHKSLISCVARKKIWRHVS